MFLNLRHLYSSKEWERIDCNWKSPDSIFLFHSIGPVGICNLDEKCISDATANITRCRVRNIFTRFNKIPKSFLIMGWFWFKNIKICVYIHLGTYMLPLGLTQWNLSRFWFKYMTKLNWGSQQGRDSNVRKQKKNSIGPILFLYHVESLVSSNLKLNLLRFHCAHPNIHTRKLFHHQKHLLKVFLLY